MKIRDIILSRIEPAIWDTGQQPNSGLSRKIRDGWQPYTGALLILSNSKHFGRSWRISPRKHIQGLGLALRLWWNSPGASSFCMDHSLGLLTMEGVSWMPGAAGWALSSLCVSCLSSDLRLKVIRGNYPVALEKIIQVKLDKVTKLTIQRSCGYLL